MKRAFLILWIASAFGFMNGDTGFRDQQYKFPKVKKALDSWEVEHGTVLGLSKIDKQNFEIYIRGFKTEKQLEVWARNKGRGYYKLVGTYTWCSSVGRVGPKRKKGDRQIPEGIYKISRFKPESGHHLSLKVNYPNGVDSVLGEKGNLGGEIYLHGGCHTIGCVPLSDEGIEQVYVWCVLARNCGQKDIPVHLFPNRLNYSNYRKLVEENPDKSLHKFWGNIRTAYQFFEQFGYPPVVEIRSDGVYLFDLEEE
jgi:murein L,D-transpeptidase YafK